MDLISRNELIKAIDDFMCHEFIEEDGEEKLGQLVKNLPIIESRPKGKWIDSGSGWKCSNCGFQNEWTIHLKYCPECSADMRGKK